MGFHQPQRIAELAVEAGARKVNLPLVNMLVLGFLGGAFIAMGFLLDIRVVAGLPHEWGTIKALLGAAVFPVGLILLIIAGGELLTGNMMAVSIACLSRKIKVQQLLTNWFWITISNFIGSLFVAYLFGHVIGLTEGEPYLATTISMAGAKIDAGFWASLISGIGCNWLVGLAVWLSYGADDITGKILAIWFPILAFVAIGFQHVVANMFVIPAAIFAGSFTWGQYLTNFIAVFIGNAIGGGVFVAMIYWIAYIGNVQPVVAEGNNLYAIKNKQRR
ncbi:formate/nitrite transporter family protein [Robertmurraya kyonggiensis]|uniref:Formate/nitrite transporter family protein n=1 Tax=Robertmurraya kyonggiensis TaxID=1037680 RepID=A0A4U1D8T0_9BACI|nr:formate/nitrite transporter family protein [Robertmurraya kyonggiensis]TKC18959.1 formate/nitrite transporter family protein [Robertmurraya kyonggiensis]